MRSLLLTIAILFGLIAVSCIDDSIDRSPQHKLEFSADTLKFGTVFTGVPTPTRRLIVLNNHKKGVEITSVRIMQESDWFSVNVDGETGSDFHDVEIRGNDSIYVYVECLVPEFDSEQPRNIEAKMQFTTNGNTQEVVLSASALNARRLDNTRITTDVTLSPELPYLVTDTLFVEKDATLTLLPGTQLLFHDKAGMRVKGRLMALGDAQNHIHLRGDRIDNVLPDVPYDILAGQWEGVVFAPESKGNRMEFVDMRSTVSGLTVEGNPASSESSPAHTEALTLVNCWLHNSQQSVLSSAHSNVNAYGCCFSEAPLAVVALTGGNHKFVQCTIANNYLFSAVTGANLTLSHCLPQDTSVSAEPLMEADFENCIIYGIGRSISPDNLDGSKVFLRYTLLKEKGGNDNNFVDCLWDLDPLFCTSRQDYIFDYRLREGSPAIGAGNPDFVTPICLYDMYGLDRLADGAPALGAYVYVP